MTYVVTRPLLERQRAALVEVMGSIIFTQSTKMAAFNYPGIVGTTSGVHVGHNDNLTDINLSGLTKLAQGDTAEEEWGDFHLTHNALLDTLNFSGLTTIDGLISIEHNAVLPTLDLSNVDGDSGAIFIEHNALLTSVDISSLDGLINDASDPVENGEINIEDNDELIGVDIAGLERVDGAMAFQDNAKIPEIAFPNLTGTVQAVAIINNALLDRVFLEGVDAISEDFALVSNPSIWDPTLVRLHDLTTVTGTIGIVDNVTLDKVTFFPALVGSVGNIYVMVNPAVTEADFSGVTNLVADSGVEDADGELFIWENPLLATLDLSAMLEVEGDLTVDGTSLVDLAANVLTGITGEIAIRNNTLMETMNLPLLEGAGPITVDGNVVLTDFSFLSMTTVTGDITVSGNTLLDLFAFEMVVGFTHEVNVSANPALTQILVSGIDCDDVHVSDATPTISCHDPG